MKVLAIGVPRLVLALVLTAVAYWTNVGNSLTVVPILFGRFVLAGRERSKAELVTGLVLTGAGTWLGRRLMKWRGQGETTTLSIADVELWSESWRKFGAKTWAHYDAYLIVLGGLLAFALVWVVVSRTRSHVPRAVVFLAVAIAALGTQFVVVGTTQWIRLNHFDLRYMYGTLALLAVGVAGAVVGPFLAAVAPGHLRVVTVLFSLLLPLTAVCQYGSPSVASARAGLDQSTGYWTADLIDTDCTHLIGDYWCVWPAMFHTNMTWADRGEDRKVWAIAMRAEVTHPQWGQSATERPRIGALAPNPALPHYTGPTPDRIGLPGMANDIFPKIKRIERRPRLWVYVRDDPSRPAP